MSEASFAILGFGYKLPCSLLQKVNKVVAKNPTTFIIVPSRNIQECKYLFLFVKDSVQRCEEFDNGVEVEQAYGYSIVACLKWRCQLSDILPELDINFGTDDWMDCNWWLLSRSF